LASEHLAHMIRRSCERHSDLPALGGFDGSEWTTITYAEMGELVDGAARSLINMGVEARDRVAIFSPNRPEWTIADMALAAVGAVSVPIFATSSVAQAAHILADAEVAIAFCAGVAEERALAEAAGGRELEIVTFGPVWDAGNAWLRAMGDPGPDDPTQAELDRRRAAGDAGEVATIIYTSGTTGQPKGARLTHANFAHQSRSVAAHFDVGPGDRSLCFLPLAHVYERSWTAHLLASGACNYYLENPRDVGEALGRVRPNVMVSVPRLYEKIHEAVIDRAAQASTIRRALFNWSLEVGYRASERVREGRALGPALAIRHRLADRLVLSKVREVVGGDKKFFSAGGAPLGKEIGEFFHAVGLLVCEGYGLTETSPMVTCNTPAEYRFGSVGKPVPECEVRIAEHDEILVRGPNVMVGYHNRPVETAEALADGWFHTGDQGRFDEDGYLFITGRIKDLIVTAGGKNIAPQPIEAELKRSSLVDNAVIIGDRRPFLVVLLSPNDEGLEKWAAAEGIPWTSTEEVTRHPRFVEAFAEVVETTNAGLASYEQIKKHAVLPLMLSIDDGTLTPTLKVKRRVVEKQYTDLIEGLYEDDR